MNHGVYPPFCSCGNGRMVLRRAGDIAKNAGRYYYKCPLENDHRGSFKWFDGLPHTKEVYMPALSTNMSTPDRYHDTECTAANYEAKRYQVCCGRGEVGVVFPPALLFALMGVVFLLLGFIVGKLI